MLHTKNHDLKSENILHQDSKKFRNVTALSSGRELMIQGMPATLPVDGKLHLRKVGSTVPKQKFSTITNLIRNLSPKGFNCYSKDELFMKKFCSKKNSSSKNPTIAS
jgi:hypothetical protein